MEARTYQGHCGSEAPSVIPVNRCCSPILVMSDQELRSCRFYSPISGIVQRMRTGGLSCRRPQPNRKLDCLLSSVRYARGRPTASPPPIPLLIGVQTPEPHSDKVAGFTATNEQTHQRKNRTTVRDELSVTSPVPVNPRRLWG